MELALHRVELPRDFASRLISALTPVRDDQLVNSMHGFRFNHVEQLSKHQKRMVQHVLCLKVLGQEYVKVFFIALSFLNYELPSLKNFGSSSEIPYA
jgi:hypothetical protein